MNWAPEPESFLSGETGHVAGVRRTVARKLGDLALDARARLSGADRRLDQLAARGPSRDVLVLSIYRPSSHCLAGAVDELLRSRHRVALALGSTGQAMPALAGHTLATELHSGKFQNLNALWELVADRRFDWLLVVDDDVVLPRRFLDRFIALCERFDLALAQPAQTLMSHAAWRVTRRRSGSYARETRFVEVGPVTAFRAEAAAELAPFPDLRWGWGLDLHWGAVAAARGWKLGVVDAVAMRHEQPVGTTYRNADAIEEAGQFLAGRPFVRSAEAQQTLVTHRTLAP